MELLSSNLRIVGQFVDTLHSAHFALDEEFYYTKFQDLIEFLNTQKEIAKLQEAFGVKSKIIDNFLELGKFQIFSAGVSGYSYVLSNDLVSIHISNSKFQNTQHKSQLKIEYRSQFLFDVGYIKAYEYGKEIAKRILGEFKSTCQRIDLATDIWGIDYKPLDFYKFQTLYVKESHSPQNFNQYMRFYRTTGFTFGRSDFRFRVYDKTLEIKQNLTKSYFKEFWALNGYRDDDNLPVWRHEVQYRRQDLKLFFLQSEFAFLIDEVEAIFGILDKLWLNVMNKVRYVDLSDSEVLRIMSGELKSDSIKKVFQRKRKNIQKNEEFDFWASLYTWDGKTLNKDGFKRHKHYSTANSYYATRSLKSFISQSYKIAHGDSSKMLELIASLENDLLHQDLTIHSYGLLKAFTSSFDVFKALDTGKLSNYEYDFIKHSYSEVDFRENFVQLISMLSPKSEHFHDVNSKFDYYEEALSLRDFTKELQFKSTLYDIGYRKAIEPEPVVNFEFSPDFDYPF